MHSNFGYRFLFATSGASGNHRKSNENPGIPRRARIRMETLVANAENVTVHVCVCVQIKVFFYAFKCMSVSVWLKLKANISGYRLKNKPPPHFISVSDSIRPCHSGGPHNKTVNVNIVAAAASPLTFDLATFFATFDCAIVNRCRTSLQALIKYSRFL